MNKYSYRKRDHTVGQTILTLRTAIGLTQGGLAELLGISRRAVGDWEAGSSYPKAGHLQHLIALGLQHQAFSPGHEAQEIRALWQATHQKMRLDEQWLASLLSQPSSPPPVTTPRLQLVRKEPADQDQEAVVPHPSTITRPSPEQRVDWGEALAVPTFYGREPEQALLTRWIVHDHCHVVCLVGMGGIGKSALAVTTMQQTVSDFDVVIFRSLRDAPSCETLLDQCLPVFSPQPLDALPGDLEPRLNRLLDHLRSVRALLVLDNLESILQEGESTGAFRSGFEGYGQLLRRVAETKHQSCLLLTSREKPAVLRPLGGRQALVRSLELSGLDFTTCEHLFAEKELVGTPEERSQLVQAYGGNPLALKIMAETITDLFCGQISLFLAQETTIFGSITSLLDEHFTRLSPLEQTIVCWLAIVREPATLEDLLALLVTPLPRTQVFEAIDSLRRRSLIERGHRQGSFTLQSVVLEYVTALLITEAAHEIQQGTLDRLIQYGLELASVPEYVRQTQERLLVAPLLARLQSASLQATSMPGRSSPVEERLYSLLDPFRQQAEYAQGYGPANLIALLRLLRGHLRGLDLSQLSLRGAYLQGVEMQDAKLCGATLHDTMLSEALDATDALAISRTGQYWATGSWQGNARVWREEGRRLYRVWQAHTDNTFTLAFHPDECTLATGSWDGTIKLWDLQSGALLWTGWHNSPIFTVAFAPDGRTLASGGNDGLIRLWDVFSGKLVQTLASQGGTVFSVVWSPDGCWLAGGCFDGSIRLWQGQERQSATSVLTLVGHTHWVHALAFAPDSTHLASGSWDNTVKLWDVASGQELQTLTGHTQQVYGVAWSPDGSTIASSSFDGMIWLWDVAEKRYRLALQGHTAVVHEIAFTPDSLRLLSGSEDTTVRLWDVTTGQCLRTIEGYEASFRDLAWSPDGQWLASAGSDRQVLLWEGTWEGTGGTPPRELRGHCWSVRGVAWSPDSRRLASCGWDNAVRVWDPITGVCLQILQDTNYADTLFYGVAWSSDGRLLAGGTYMHGLHVWDMTTYVRRWLGCQNPTWIHRVAWSPDGTRLVSCENDGLSLWKASDGTLLGRLEWQQARMLNAAWSPDGRLLACGGCAKDGGAVLVWETTGEHKDEPVQTLSRLPGAVFAVAWSPNGKVLISGGSTGKIAWWDLESGACLARREGHRGAVQALKVTPNGHWLASCGDDSTIQVWDLESTELLYTLRRDRPYERLDITGIQGLTEAQKDALYTLGAITRC